MKYRRTCAVQWARGETILYIIIAAQEMPEIPVNEWLYQGLRTYDDLVDNEGAVATQKAIFVAASRKTRPTSS